MTTFIIIQDSKISRKYDKIQIGPSVLELTDYLILAALVALTTAAPQYNYSGSDEDSSESNEVVPILRDDRVLGNDGSYNFDAETGNGIVLLRSGSPDGPDDSVVISGQYSYTAPDGTPVVVKFVADENGFQPESDLLPVAPAFPHPIPQFVLDQIAFAAEEDAARERAVAAVSSEEVSSPVRYYDAPQ
ncbi:cuticle protein AM1199-like [Homarus americanus]|uniref:cuticle protein AM1199-like n=1 Tax=Homarus americanus TaxID=6706 RepID=UPI001C46CA66|nr:cuticle protein AM1199-like [Homarus americanus]